ncbi:MAG: nicotinate (nicotinamide) nucleotide adenylyltransferase [Bacteroidaceae bacterium]|nr:nicotinate (nicotinamide) nucleotide adenylyltransferase [Bacteroidaceae bacterium]
MRIGIYGGTYNPIHIGHTSLANSLVQQGLVDEVWLLVSPQNPLKGNNSASYTDRFRMAQLATEGMEHIKASDFELHLPVPSYTITTLTELSKEFPEHQFTLIIGADNWKNFNRWYKADEIKANYRIIVYPRPGYEEPIEANESNNTPKFKVGSKRNKPILLGQTENEEIPLFDISSTEIRNGEKLEMLHPAVLKYIRDNKLYEL